MAFASDKNKKAAAVFTLEDLARQIAKSMPEHFKTVYNIHVRFKNDERVNGLRVGAFHNFFSRPAQTKVWPALLSEIDAQVDAVVPKDSFLQRQKLMELVAKELRHQVAQAEPPLNIIDLAMDQLAIQLDEKLFTMSQAPAATEKSTQQTDYEKTNATEPDHRQFITVV